MSNHRKKYRKWSPYRKEPYWGRYRTQRLNAERRGISFKLFYPEWFTIWIASGHINECGRKKHNYVMSRNKDEGAYEIGNVKITTVAENCGNNYSRKIQSKVEREKRAQTIKAHWAALTPTQRKARIINMRGRTHPCN